MCTQDMRKSSKEENQSTIVTISEIYKLVTFFQ